MGRNLWSDAEKYIKIWYPWSDQQPTYWHLNSIVTFIGTCWTTCFMNTLENRDAHWVLLPKIKDIQNNHSWMRTLYPSPPIYHLRLVNATLNWKQAIPQTPHTLWCLNCVISWQVQNVLSLKPPSLMLEPPIQIIKEMFQIWWYLVLIPIMWWETPDLLIAPH